jgi:hypothetical protein
MNTPENIATLAPNEIFVFGSNLAGIHGAGAARVAVEKFGAVYGHGEGPQGRCWAIPTKDRNIKTLPLDRIAGFVARFLEAARKTPELTFLVTKIGCGLAGYEPRDIAPMFRDAPANVILPIEFSK